MRVATQTRPHPSFLLNGFVQASLRVTIDEIFDRFDTSNNGLLEEDDFRPYGTEALQIFKRLQSIYVSARACPRVGYYCGLLKCKHSFTTAVRTHVVYPHA
jgi:hypothetical protein